MIRQTTTMQKGREPQTLAIVQKVLLVCGIVSSLVYVGTDILAASLWDAYTYTAQEVSELMAIGAPTRPLLVAGFSLYDLLIMAFGTGVFAAAGRKRGLRFTGILLITYGIVGLVALIFYPMHMRGVPATLTDTMHIAATMVLNLLMMLYIGFGAAAGGKGFRQYSLVTILVILVFGVLTGVIAGPRLYANLPTPWLGVTERVCIYSSMLWVLMWAILLLRAENSGNAADAGIR